ncbi:MAG: hypothetical protein N2C12_03095 [Planctomycetales bacterium]
MPMGPDEPQSTVAPAGRRYRILLCMFLGSVAGGLLGWLIGTAGFLTVYPPDARLPAPHLVPKFAGATAFSVAMVEDVIHERFLCHCDQYYQARTSQSRKMMDGEKATAGAAWAPSHEYLLEMDNISVGYDMTHHPDRAVEVQKEKLELVRPLEVAWHAKQLTRANRTAVELTEDDLALYRTYANLGTHMIHVSLPQTFAGDPEAGKQFEKGLELVRLAVKVNPGAHFGRENWQIVAGEYVLAVNADPDVMLKYDMFGNRLSSQQPLTNRLDRVGWTDYVLQHDDIETQIRRLRSTATDEDSQQADRDTIREQFITRVGAEGKWSSRTGSSLKHSVPFDEPVLGVLGMWMLGGGANPHFALFLGGTMERIGEYSTAWYCYERALGMSDRFSQRPKIRNKLTKHCTTRQAWLAKWIATEQKRSVESVEMEMRNQHQRDLSNALQYREKLHAYERQMVANGKEINDPNFYNEFFSKNGRIATEVKIADSTPIRLTTSGHWLNNVPPIIMLAAIGALIGYFLSILSIRRNNHQAPV